DVERVEILKGPQGTLFGKNTASGAVQFLTNKPDLEAVDGFIEAQAGNEGFANLKGAISVPIVEGTAAFRLSGSWAERDGFVENITTGTDLNNRDRFNLRGQFLYDNGQNLSVRVIADHSEIDEQCCAASNIFDGPADTTANFLAAGGVLPPTGNLPGASYILPLDVVAGLVGFTGTPVVLADQFDRYQTAADIDPFAQIEESGLSVEVNYDINETITFTSVTAYRTYDADDFVDADFSALDILSASGGTTEQSAISQEFRLDGSIGDRTNFVAGLYYFDQELDRETTLQLGTAANILLTGGLPTSFFIPGGAATCPFIGISDAVCNGPAFPAGEGSDNISTQEQTSWAAFAQFDFDLTEDLVLTAGLRYLDEQKDMNVVFTETIFTPVFDAFTPLSPSVPDVDNVTFDDTAVTGTLKLSYFINPEVMVYASYGRGYKSGGTNIDRISPATGAPLLFDPETSDSFELGMKGDFLENRLRVNAAVHQTNFDDFQANTFVGTGFVLQNAGEIASRGFEVDVQALVAPWLTVVGGAAYVDAEYDSFVGGSCIRTPFGNEPDAGQPQFPTVCDASGNTVGGTSEWTFFTSLITDRQIGEGFGYGRLDVNWRDDVPAGTDNDPNKTGDDGALVNLRLGYRFGGDRYDASIWAKNLLDEEYQLGGFNSVIREGSLSAYFTEPRTYGATFRVNFQ
ncbi:MAG: TonB-dependent receptor, partial [Pseudomonadota bacterium]